MSDGKKILYWGSGSTPCWKAMIVLAEKNISYESKQISFDKKEHKGKEVTDLNPRGQVPVFRDGDTIINESNAICFYLERNNPEPKLIPSDPQKCAKVLQRGFEALENLHSKMMLNLMYLYYQYNQTKDEKLMEKIAENKPKLIEELNTWEKYLEKDAYAGGKEFSMADVFFFPYIAWSQRMSLKLDDRFPYIKAYYEKLLQRPSIQSSMPPHWKESPNLTQLEDC